MYGGGCHDTMTSTFLAGAVSLAEVSSVPEETSCEMSLVKGTIMQERLYGFSGAEKKYN